VQWRAAAGVEGTLPCSRGRLKQLKVGALPGRRSARCAGSGRRSNSSALPVPGLDDELPDDSPARLSMASASFASPDGRPGNVLGGGEFRAKATRRRRSSAAFLLRPDGRCSCRSNRVACWGSGRRGVTVLAAHGRSLEEGGPRGPGGEGPVRCLRASSLGRLQWLSC